MIDKILLKMGWVKLPKPKDDEVVVHPFVRKKHLINTENFIKELELPEFPIGTPSTKQDNTDSFYHETEQLSMTDPRD